MEASAAGVVRISPVRREIALVCVEGLGDGDGAIVGGGDVPWLAAGERTGCIDRLPIGANGLAIGGLQIIGQSDALEPVDTGAGDANRPRARAFVAAVCELDVR